MQIAITFIDDAPSGRWKFGQIANVYAATTSVKFNDERDDPRYARHLPVPEGSELEALTPAQRVGLDEWFLVEDSVKAAQVLETRRAQKRDELTEERDALLAACDWTQLADTALSNAKKAEWATYRQALRDLFSGEPDPLTLVLPTPPTESDPESEGIFRRLFSFFSR